ncbi:MAG TPA: UbiX family flavin prenyltransferase, partial [Geobacterales bacterium]|nr:UbiX family flavin prenyltransferase [Geobacterales bacterium]
ETGADWQGDEKHCNRQVRQHFGADADHLTYYDEGNLFAPIASGSAAADAMVVVPCSMGSVARIAAGISGTLLERAADVMLKEQRPLILVPRETPLSQIHLENLLRLSRAGARIVPAMPAFYHHPSSMDELVNFMVGKILDQLGIEQLLFPPWQG